jgi:hypothetical protein
MKLFCSAMLRVLKKLADLASTKSALARRTLLKTEARERKEFEADRLDRLRNPGNYRGR